MNPHKSFFSSPIGNIEIVTADDCNSAHKGAAKVMAINLCVRASGKRGVSSEADAMAKEVVSFLSSYFSKQERSLPQDIFYTEDMSDFTKRTLMETLSIPYGSVTTYKGLARRVGSPLAARAVGTVMANNPFPILIPCHRLIKSSRHIGEYAGGAEVKRKLLENEGIKIDSAGRVEKSFIINALA